MAQDARPPEKKAGGKWYLVTLSIKRLIVFTESIPNLPGGFIWHVNTSRYFPQIIAQGIVSADEETEAKKYFWQEFWADQVVTSLPVHSKQKLKEFVEQVCAHFGDIPPHGLSLEAELLTDERTAAQWESYCRHIPKLSGLVASLKQRRRNK